MLELFFGGLLQAVVLAFNIRNISQRNVLWSMLTSFLLSLVWAYVIREIARDLDSAAHIFAYATGVSFGTAIGGYVNLSIPRAFQRAKPNRCKTEKGD